MTIGQGLIAALAVVWILSVIWWGVEGALTRYQRRIVRQRRIDPDWIASDETARLVFTVSKRPPNLTLLRQAQRTPIRRGYTQQGDGR